MSGLRGFLTSAVLLIAVSIASGTLADATTTPRLALEKGDRIVILGNTFAERMQQYGNFETLLHSRFPQHQLVVRGLGWSADELSIRLRSRGFEDHGHRLKDHRPSVVLACFGFNESFAGPQGLAKFEKDLEKFIRETTSTAYDGKRPPRLALISPIAHENLRDRSLPDGAKNNENLKLYSDAMARLAAAHQVAFVDLFLPTLEGMKQTKPSWTINGVHLNAIGDEQVSKLLDVALFGPREEAESKIDLAKLKREIEEKNQQFWYDYRAVNGCYIYGQRNKPFGVVNFPPEFAKLRNMIAIRDERIWAVAQGREVPDTIDDDNTGELPVIESNMKGPITITTPQEELQQFKLADGYEANLFASEIEFPDLQKPVQFEFDSRGRLWVCTMPSYPMYMPGVPVDDKVLIFEDTDSDGHADRQTIFADQLYLPTGIELGDGGAYVAQQPNLVHLKDTDGDDRADQREIILHGFDSADSHHSISAFTWGPDGALYFQEGTFHRTQVETPYGPQRVKDAAVFRFDPRTAKFEVFVSYPFANPWGHVFDRWGQNFVADASGGSCYYGTAFSGQVDYPRKHGNLRPLFDPRWRPLCGSEFITTRHFPDEAQGTLLLNNVIGFHGALAYKLREEGAGFFADPTTPLLESKDQNFRPVDLKFGPDGALYVIDWFNPLVGHMQHSVRDPNRDKTHGRIWRITYKGRPLLQSPQIADASIRELLNLLKEYEDRTRYRVRRELRSRDTEAVMRELDQWIAALDPNDAEYQHHLLESLWLRQQHDVVDQPLLQRMLRSPDFRARAAATRVLCYWRDRVDDSLALLRAQASDDHPRVRLETIRAASFYNQPEAIDIAMLAAADLSHDVYIQYALKETLNTLEPRIPPAERELRNASVDTILERGSAEQLARAYRDVVADGGASAESKRRVLEALALAAETRKVFPQVDLAALVAALHSSDASTARAALRLATAWKATQSLPTIEQMLAADELSVEDRFAAIDAVVSIGGKDAKAVANRLIKSKVPQLRASGIAVLAAIDVDQAAARAPIVFADERFAQFPDLLLRGFLRRQGGTDKLASALRSRKISADTAKLALRRMYLEGRSDAALVEVLSTAAGINMPATLPNEQELAKLVAEVQTSGDAARGELVFRRGDLGCMKCHAVSGAGGDVGPDLSPVGAASPIEYLITSILQPDLNIKENFLTRTIYTSDGFVHQGIVVDRDQDRVILKDGNGRKSTIASADIEEEEEGKSLMPKGLTGFLTHDEFLDLVKFLSQLGKPGDYSVRSQSTIQRWRYLAVASDEAAANGKRPRQFGEEESRWLPAYAKVAGALPLDELTQGETRSIVYLRAGINMTESGEIELKFDTSDGVTIWLDDQPLVESNTKATLQRGTHTIGLVVDLSQRKNRELRVQVDKPQNSLAAFTVVGGP